MNNTVKMCVAVVVGYATYIGVSMLLGDRPDDAGGWIRLLVGGVLIMLIVVATVEWMNRRRRAAVNSGMSSGSPDPRPTVSDPPTEG